MKLILIVLTTVILVAACGPGPLTPVPSGEDSPQLPLPATNRLLLGTASMTEADLSSAVLSLSADALARAIEDGHGRSVETQPPRLMRIAELKQQGQFLSSGFSDSDKVLVREATGTFTGTIAGSGGTLVPQPFHRLTIACNPLTGSSIATEWPP